jgi:hypothetical protein
MLRACSSAWIERCPPNTAEGVISAKPKGIFDFFGIKEEHPLPEYLCPSPSKREMWKIFFEFNSIYLFGVRQRS